MGRYLKLAMAVTDQSVPIETADVPVTGGRVSPRPEAGRDLKIGIQGKPCGSAGCAGCYDIGDGRRIHPPKSG